MNVSASSARLAYVFMTCWETLYLPFLRLHSCFKYAYVCILQNNIKCFPWERIIGHCQDAKQQNIDCRVGQLGLLLLMPGVAELKLEAGVCHPDQLLLSFPQHFQIHSWQTTKQANSFKISISINYSILISIFDNTNPRQLKPSLHEPRITQSEHTHHLFLPSTSK
jgi:hypothetical protein